MGRVNEGEQLKYDSKTLTQVMVNLFCRKKGSSVLGLLCCSSNFGVSVMQLEMWE